MSLPCGMMILSQPARALVDELHATCNSKLVKILQKNKVLHCREDFMHITDNLEESGQEFPNSTPRTAIDAAADCKILSASL
jgi:hypothetical protein